MNSDVLALYLSIALALTKTIESMLNKTLTGYELFFTLWFSSLFWFSVRNVCDVLTWKDYVRRWGEGAEMIYVFRDEKPIRYIMWFLAYLLFSAWMAIIVVYGSGK